MRKRLVFTDGLKNKFAFQDFEDGVYAIIGPFGNFTHDPELQDALTEVCRRYNLKHGHLSPEKYQRLKGWKQQC